MHHSPDTRTRNGSGVPATILVVEDDPNVRYVIVGGLRLAGYEIEIETTGRAALERLRTNGDQIGLVVLDVMLPDLDGFEVCRRLRRDRLETPIIFLTARDTLVDRVEGLTIGGDDYLAKPFGIEELVVRISVILRRVGRHASMMPLTSGPLTLDDDAHVVRLRDTEVSLSPTEYKLLRYLMLNKGRALSRGQILDHVWDYGFAGESTVVESFISTLRKRVDPEGTLIQTIRGVGYRLEG
ncbi:MAG TPA: response regulator transcription factor [Thermomicrobiales bacterium]|nr:response regulator transcription factor [Thermomicrobiales bacterium]